MVVTGFLTCTWRLKQIPMRMTEIHPLDIGLALWKSGTYLVTPRLASNSIWDVLFPSVVLIFLVIS